MYSSTAVKSGGSVHIWTPPLPESGGVRTPGPPRIAATGRWLKSKEWRELLDVDKTLENGRFAQH